MALVYGRGAGMDAPGAEHSVGLEAVAESFWNLGLGGGAAAAEAAYPERPRELDCTYYLRTGVCGYGDRCRYNHPRDRSVGAVAARSGVAEYPERVGQPSCQYFLKTGTCKFGQMCKYNHPRPLGGSVQPVPLNCYGYPLRPGEKECSFYVRTRQCQYGAICKYHHPEPAVASTEHTFYPAMLSSSDHSQQFQNLGSWQVARPSMLPASYAAGHYSPVIVSSSGVVPAGGWSPYPAPAGFALSSGGQPVVQPGTVYQQPSHSPSSYTGSYLPLSVPLNGSQRESIFPERPGQPECRYYLMTGDCKYGSMCKYDHPSGWSIPKTNCLLSPLGLPIRPGVQPCPYYTRHGVCKFGPTCKFSHPMGLRYSPSVSSLGDMPVAPYPAGGFQPLASPSLVDTPVAPYPAGGVPAVALAVSAPSSEHRPEFAPVIKDPRTPVPEILSAGPVVKSRPS